MSTSGTYTFNPSLGDLTLYAYQLIGLRPTAIMQEHISTAGTAANMMLANWSNRGVNLWQVQRFTIPLVAGTASYSVEVPTVVMLEAYVTTAGVDRLILPVSRTEYMSYPNKAQQGFPTTYWFQRLLTPVVTLWPVPDGTQTSMTYSAVLRVQDANMNGVDQVDIPPIWLEAFAYGLAYRLAIMWAPDKAQPIKAIADEAYDVASAQDIETAQQYISPQVSGYFR